MERENVKCFLPIVGDPWRYGMTLRVKRDTIMEPSDWSVRCWLVVRLISIPPDPIVASSFFHSSSSNCCKILIFGRKTEQLLPPESLWVGLTVGVRGAKFYKVCITFYRFLLSSSWSNWYFKHPRMSMAWIVKS